MSICFLDYNNYLLTYLALFSTMAAVALETFSGILASSNSTIREDEVIPIPCSCLVISSSSFADK